MPDVFVANATPKNLEWWGIGREVATSTPFVPSPGTITAPSMTIPLNSGDPDDAATPLPDKALRGDMGEDYNEVLGTRMADFPLNGNVYLDSIGHLLYNLFGDYTATGSTTGFTSTGTITPAVGVGIAAATAVSITAPTGSAPFYFQIGNGTTDPFEVIVCSAATVSSITPVTPGFRFSHLAGAVIKQVGAPFVHSFALLNGGGLFGLPANAQPVTHTLTHHNALPANASLNASYTGSRQYPFWCADSLDFALSLNQLFTYTAKGSSLIGVDATTNLTSSQTDAGANPVWQFKVGIGGPASGGTLVNNIESATVSPARTMANKWALAGQQDPVLIGRLGLAATGQLTFIAVDESPLLNYLAGSPIGQLQLAMTNGLSGASLQGVTFNFSRAFYEKASLSDPDMMTYTVPFRGLMNTTDVGASGARGPMTVQVTNAVPTY